MDSLKCLTSTHLFTLIWLHSIPWFPLSLSMGSLTFVNIIHNGGISHIVGISHIYLRLCSACTILNSLRFQLLAFPVALLFFSYQLQKKPRLLQLLCHCVKGNIFGLIIIVGAYRYNLVRMHNIKAKLIIIKYISRSCIITKLHWDNNQVNIDWNSAEDMAMWIV